jgi:hypothetical protein
VYTFCKYKFGLSSITNQNAKNIAFNKIFDTMIPEGSLFTHYVYQNYTQTSCAECEQLNNCKKTYLSDVEELAHDYLELRDCDEIQQMKGVLHEIIAKVEKAKSVYSYEDIIDEFHSEEIKIKRDLKKTFPDIERWTNVSVITSIPITLLGMATGSLPVACAGQTVAGLSTILKEMTSRSKSKHKWTGFRAKNRRRIKR